jgi:tRNA nucleotidyltransferase (CCA-adding enzyme)
MQIYLVGGAVRDELLGRVVRERDWVVVGSSVDEMIALGYRQKDPQFPVFVHPGSGEEYALARRERKQGHGHKGFTLEHGKEVSLRQDLARRDLTINAMARDLEGALVDPFGGRGDLDHRILRHVTPAFCEDPLRVLRLARFLAELAEFDFRIADETARIAADMSTGPELESLSPGRIWRETARALASPHPAAYFVALRRFGALPRVLPWLTSERDPGGERAIAALERVCGVSPQHSVRMATLATAASQLGGAEGLPDARWPLPAESRGLAALCIAHPPPEAVDADAVVDWLQRVDAWRRDRRFGNALSVWGAVSPQAASRLDALLRARDASRRVDPPPADEDPRHAVRSARVSRVREALRGREV